MIYLSDYQLVCCASHLYCIYLKSACGNDCETEPLNSNSLCFSDSEWNTNCIMSMMGFKYLFQRWTCLSKCDHVLQTLTIEWGCECNSFILVSLCLLAWYPDLTIECINAYIISIAQIVNTFRMCMCKNKYVTNPRDNHLLDSLKLDLACSAMHIDQSIISGPVVGLGQYSQLW